MHRSLAFVLACAAALGASPALAVVNAHAVLIGQQGEPIGTVTLIQSQQQGVVVHLEAGGLQPGGHAFHIHERGACEPTFEAAGGHYNPDGLGHGFLAPEGYHAGDLPNVFVDEGGIVRADAFNLRVSLDEGAPNTLFDEDGSAVIIHDYLDSYGDEPVSGGRVACGVIVPGLP